MASKQPKKDGDDAKKPVKEEAADEKKPKAPQGEKKLAKPAAEKDDDSEGGKKSLLLDVEKKKPQAAEPSSVAPKPPAADKKTKDEASVVEKKKAKDESSVAEKKPKQPDAAADKKKPSAEQPAAPEKKAPPPPLVPAKAPVQPPPPPPPVTAAKAPPAAPAKVAPLPPVAPAKAPVQPTPPPPPPVAPAKAPVPPLPPPPPVLTSRRIFSLPPPPPVAPAKAPVPPLQPGSIAKAPVPPTQPGSIAKAPVPPTQPGSIAKAPVPPPPVAPAKVPPRPSSEEVSEDIYEVVGAWDGGSESISVTEGSVVHTAALADVQSTAVLKGAKEKDVAVTQREKKPKTQREKKPKTQREKKPKKERLNQEASNIEQLDEAKAPSSGVPPTDSTRTALAPPPPAHVQAKASTAQSLGSVDVTTEPQSSGTPLLPHASLPWDARVLQGVIGCWTKLSCAGRVPVFFVLLALILLLVIVIGAAVWGGVASVRRASASTGPSACEQNPLCPAYPIWTNCSPQCVSYDMSLAQYFHKEKRIDEANCVVRLQWRPCFGDGCSPAPVKLPAEVQTSGTIRCMQGTIGPFDQSDRLADSTTSSEVKLAECKDGSEWCFAAAKVDADGAREVTLGCYLPDAFAEDLHQDLRSGRSDDGVGCGKFVGDGECRSVELTVNVGSKKVRRPRFASIFTTTPKPIYVSVTVEAAFNLCCCNGDLCNSGLTRAARNRSALVTHRQSCHQRFRSINSTKYEDLAKAPWQTGLPSTQDCLVHDLCYDFIWSPGDGHLYQNSSCRDFAPKNIVADCLRATLKCLRYDAHHIPTCCCQGDRCLPANSLIAEVNSTLLPIDVRPSPPPLHCHVRMRRRVVCVDGRCSSSSAANESCAAGDVCYELATGAPPQSSAAADDAIVRGCVAGATVVEPGALAAACARHADACFVTHDAAGAEVSVCCCGATGCNDGAAVRAFQQEAAAACEQPARPWWPFAAAVACLLIALVFLTILALLFHAIWTLEKSV